MLFTAAYKVGGTKSHRLSSLKLLGEFAGNVQNVPDNLRRLFKPKPGYLFVQADLEGAESVATSLLCGEGNYRELVRQKVKTHNYLCTKIFPSCFEEFFTAEVSLPLKPAEFKAHVNYKSIVKHCKSLQTEYALAKMTVHGVSYGMGWSTFQEAVLKGTQGRLVLTAAECKRLLNTFFEFFPEIRIFQINTEKLVKDFITINNLFGHSITFISRFTSALARTGISWAPQSTVGVCTILAACNFQDWIEANNKTWDILNIVHDSILVQCPEDESIECADRLSHFMSMKFVSPVDGWECSIGVERQLGLNWGKYDEKENPEGVKVL